MKNLPEHVQVLYAHERSSAGEALEQDAAERKQIASPIQRLLLNLFGGHVGRRADNPVRLRQARDCCVARGGVCRGNHLGDAKVQELGLTLWRQHHVLRLQIAMDDVAAMSGSERVGDLSRDAQRVGKRQRATSQARGQRFARHVLHDHVRPAGRIGADVVDRADAGMIERSNRLRFLQQPPGDEVARPPSRVDELDRHIAAQRRVAGEIHLAHAARADQPAQPITSEFGALGLRFHCSEGGIISSFGLLAAGFWLLASACWLDTIRGKTVKGWEAA